MAKNKSTPMTLVVAILSVATVLYAVHSWTDWQETQVAMLLAVLGLGLAYYSIKISKFEEFIRRGLLWAGLAMIVIATFFSWESFEESVRPLIVGGLLVAAIWFGTKFKRFLI